MKKAGLWIDHRKAVIVIVSEPGEEIKEITSNMEKHVRFTGGQPSEMARPKTCGTGNLGTTSTTTTIELLLSFVVQTPSKYLVPARPKAS